MFKDFGEESGIGERLWFVTRRKVRDQLWRGSIMVPAFKGMGIVSMREEHQQSAKMVPEKTCWVVSNLTGVRS